MTWYDVCCLTNGDKITSNMNRMWGALVAHLVEKKHINKKKNMIHIELHTTFCNIN